MTQTIFGLYGAGGSGREVMPLVRAQHSSVCFVETSPPNWASGLPLISEDAFFRDTHYEKKLFNVAIANSKARQQIAERCIANDCIPSSIRAKSSVIYDDNTIGEGDILCNNTTITSRCWIGKFFHANLNAYVGHDCLIGDYVTFSPNVACSGNVRIGDHVFIGAGAIIIPKITIGSHAVIGAGAIVTKDVPEGVTVVGNPARIVSKS